MQMSGSIQPAVNTPNSSNLLLNSLSSGPSLTSEADENIQDRRVFFFFFNCRVSQTNDTLSKKNKTFS